jgi:hypothetical protein
MIICCSIEQALPHMSRTKPWKAVGAAAKRFSLMATSGGYALSGGAQQTPHVDQVESGVWRYGWTRPFVQYRYEEQDGRVGTVRFVAAKPHDPKLVFEADKSHAIYFLAILNGLSTPGGPDPPELGAGEIARQWPLHCAVAATAIFE